MLGKPQRSWFYHLDIVGWIQSTKVCGNKKSPCVRKQDFLISSCFLYSHSLLIYPLFPCSFSIYLSISISLYPPGENQSIPTSALAVSGSFLKNLEWA